MQKQSRNTVLAMVGKGGVGKTSLSAIMVRLLSEAHPQGRILAIDADPAVGLATALGIEPRFTVDDIRKEFIQTVEGGEAKAAVEMLGEAKYRLLDALTERDNISFLAIGRPEAAGCYCKVNAYLKEVV
ncbi:MAG: AAA family ATPase, partial [Clostridia bacterium]|nr:AAA family ATPase [Clostridia bacterium]